MYVCMHKAKSTESHKYVCIVWYVCIKAESIESHKYVCVYGMVCMHKALKHNLDESGSELPQPLNTIGRINIINAIGRINTTASRDYVEASGN